MNGPRMHRPQEFRRITANLLALLLLCHPVLLIRGNAQRPQGTAKKATAPNPGDNVAVGYDANAAVKPAAQPTSPYITELITLLIGSPEFQQR